MEKKRFHIPETLSLRRFLILPDTSFASFTGNSNGENKRKIFLRRKRK